LVSATPVEGDDEEDVPENPAVETEKEST
jgi:hypothetical protein